MQDYYAERLRPLYRYHHHLQPISYSYFSDHESQALDSLRRHLTQPSRPRRYVSDSTSTSCSTSDSESDRHDIEKATRAHIAATAEYDKAKEKSDEAKKKLDECEAKVQAATKRLERAKKELRRLCRRW